MRNAHLRVFLVLFWRGEQRARYRSIFHVMCAAILRTGKKERSRTARKLISAHKQKTKEKVRTKLGQCIN